jgi:hypothetical protein
MPGMDPLVQLDVLTVSPIIRVCAPLLAHWRVVHHVCAPVITLAQMRNGLS